MSIYICIDDGERGRDRNRERENTYTHICIMDMFACITESGLRTEISYACNIDQYCRILWGFVGTHGDWSIIKPIIVINFFADVTHDPGGRARGDEMWFGMWDAAGSFPGSWAAEDSRWWQFPNQISYGVLDIHYRLDIHSISCIKILEKLSLNWALRFEKHVVSTSPTSWKQLCFHFEVLYCLSRNRPLCIGRPRAADL
jgi:hypothetical protein